MKGSLKTARAGEHLSQTNFNDWSDPKYKSPPKIERVFHDKSDSLLGSKEPLGLEPTTSEKSLKSVASRTSIDINEIKNKIKQGHPLMTKKEIRSFRLPFFESLLLNLKEDGFLLTNDFINDLIAIDDAYHKDLETNISLKQRPILKYSKSVLISLSEGLIDAETARINEEKNQEASAFLDLAILFSKDGDPSWFWIAHEMFEQCMEVMKSTENPVEIQLKATAKYLYGLFLFYELHDLNEAKSQTECSMKISEGKLWTIGDTKEKKGKSLYTESCILLHKIFLDMADREMINENTEEAIQFCRNGLLWAKVMNNKPGEIEALRKLINIYLEVQQLFSVSELLEKYMKFCTDLEDFEGLCEGYILFARYHDSIGEKANVIEDMNNLLRVAKEHNVTKMIAMAHHKLATYCLMRGADKGLLEHAIEAYMSYLDIKKNSKETEEARCMVGVAQGLEIMTEYCNLVLDADCFNLIEQMVLLGWKDLRIPFFDKKFEFIPEMSTNADIVNKMEGKKLEDVLAQVERRHSELVSSSTKRESEFNAIRASTPMFQSLIPSFSSSHLSLFRKSKSNLREQSSLHKSSTARSLTMMKARTVSFMSNSEMDMKKSNLEVGLPANSSASAIMENLTKKSNLDVPANSSASAIIENLTKKSNLEIPANSSASAIIENL